jgi:hypothetical protein
MPFDAITSSRYWMAGLVANGFVLVAYAGINTLLGRLATIVRRTYIVPVWSRVWLWTAPLLLFGIPAITMTANQPTLPFSLALACTGVTLAGLALALMPGAVAARSPWTLLWIALNGLGLVPILLLLRVHELPGLGVITRSTSSIIVVGSVMASCVWLALLTVAQRGWRLPQLSSQTLLLCGCAWSYLLLPLVHYLLFTPPAYRYVSAATNFFAADVRLQLVTFLIAGLLALAVSYWRYHCVHCTSPIASLAN